jgi:hypothetical protein
LLLRLRAECRAHWRSWLGLALLVGVSAGLVIAAAAGARRTETAVPRSAAAANFSDVTISQFGRSSLDFDRIRRLAHVAYAYRSDNFFFTGQTDRGRPLDVGAAGLIASADASVGRTRDAPAILRGRRADPARLDEAVADEEAAGMLGLRVGSTFTANFAGADQLQAFIDYTGDPTKFRTTGPRMTFRVVGISAVFSTATANYPEVQLTSAFYRAHAARVARSPTFAVYLERGQSDVARFTQSVQPLARGEEVGFGARGDFVDEVQRGVHVQAAALRLLAGLAAFVALLALGQAVARQTFQESLDYPALRAIGMTSRQFVGLAAARAAAIAGAGALVSVGVAIALSPIAPVGAVARKAEPDPGVSVDVSIIAAGIGLTLVLLVTVSVLSAWLAARRSEDVAAGSRRASTLSSRLARAGFALTIAVGVRMALEPGRGKTAVPVRSTLAGVAVAMAAIAMALTFGASLDRLVRTPALFGQTWDAEFGDGFSPDVAKQAYPELEKDRFVAAFAGGTVKDVAVDGHRVGLLALERAQGSIEPTVVEGRAPAAAGEILLSSKTLDETGTAVGDIVRVSAGKSSRRMRVVGEGVISDVVGAHGLLGHGAMLTFDGYRELVPQAARNFFFVRFKEGADRKQALASLSGAGVTADSGAKPADVVNFNRVDSMPTVLAGLLALIAVVTVLHALLTSMRRRQRDLAILKVLGVRRAQISRMVAWQAATIVAIGALIGIPAGVAGGRWAWRVFADGLGVVPDPVVPIGLVLLIAPAALLVAALIALVPALTAARSQPAVVLRSE